MMSLRKVFSRPGLGNFLKQCSHEGVTAGLGYRLHPRFSSFMIKADTDHSEVQRIPLQWGEPRQVLVESLSLETEDWRRGSELMELHPDVWAVYPRIDLIHANVVWQSKYNRVNYNHTKSVKEMIYTYGGGAKPWPQKGTGRARQGSRRAPQWVNGGKVHGPRGPKPLYYMLPHHIRVYGLTHTLSVKLAQDDLHVVDNFDLSSDDPEDLLALVRTRNWSPSVLFVDTEDTFPLSITTASDKLGHLNLMPVHGLNVYSMVKHHTLVLTKRAVERITDKLLFALHRSDQSDAAFRSAKGPTELSLKMEKHRPVV